MSYNERRQWADKYIPEMKKIIGPHLLEPSPFEIDTKQAADLVVLRAKNVCIACRVRRHAYLAKYGNEFTIRYALSSGTETEHSKIINGWADWMFYGFAEASDYRKDFAQWVLLDLSAFRAHLIRDPKREVIQWSRISNREEEDSDFIAYRLDSFKLQPPLIIAQSAPQDSFAVQAELFNGNGAIPF